MNSSLRKFIILFSVLALGGILVIALFVFQPARLTQRGKAHSPEEARVSLAPREGAGLFPTAAEEITVKQIQRIGQISAVEDLNSLAVSPDRQSAFLPSYDENVVYVLDLTTDTVKDKIALKLPFAAAVHPQKNSLYVTTGEDWLVEIDLTSLSELARIKLPPSPRYLAFDPKGLLFVIHELGNSVSVVNTESNTLVTRLGVGERPRGIVYQAQRIYVTNFAGASVSVISTVSLRELRRIPLQGRPNQIVADPKRQRVYITDSFNNQVLVLDTDSNELVSQITVDEFPYGMALDSRAENLYVTGFAQNTLSVINLENLTMMRTIRTAPAFQTQAGFNIVQIFEKQRKIYLINSLTGQVLVYTF